MAKKQTRRSVSLNRNDYEAAKQEAERRGVTLVGLVESGLAAIGVPIGAHPRQSREFAQANAVLRAESIARREGVGRHASRECTVLGDHVADAYGLA